MSWARLIVEIIVLSTVTGSLCEIIYKHVFKGTKSMLTALMLELILFFLAAHIYLYGLGRREIILKKFGITEEDKNGKI